MTGRFWLESRNGKHALFGRRPADAVWPLQKRKRHSDEDILKLLREIELKLTAGDDVASACRSVGISDATFYNWRRRFGGMGRSQLSEMKSLEKENARLKKIVAELELDKLILKEILHHLKLRA
ncbi:MAG: transposase [Pseudomonadota bacterium]